ncbi:hypothetical protein [Gemella morbillorum]|uniref:hypothetical protein n=1 Tax=Gemella morbillorum TaxID=29391 RepID=UPI00248E6F8E|nr:hypothetical protein [Gemella morbillorum]
MFNEISESRKVVLGVKLNKFEVTYLLDLLYFYKLTDKLTITDLNTCNRLISRLCLLYGVESSGGIAASIGSMRMLQYQPFNEEETEEVDYSTQVVEGFGGVSSVLIFDKNNVIIEEYRKIRDKGIATFNNVEYLNFAVSKEELPILEKALRFALNIESRFSVIKFKIRSLLTRIRCLDLLYKKIGFLKVDNLKVLKTILLLNKDYKSHRALGINGLGEYPDFVLMLDGGGQK